MRLLIFLHTATLVAQITANPAAVTQTFPSNGTSTTATPATAMVSISGSGSVTLTPTTQSGGNWLSVTPANAALPLTATITMDPSGLPDGTYLGSIAAGSGSVPVTIMVGNPGPQLAPGGIVNAASNLGGAISPGEIVTISGISIGPGIPYSAQIWDGVTMTKLAGARVWFGTTPAPVISASANQLTVVVPYEVAGNLSVPVQVENLVARTPAFSVAVQPSTPALYTVNNSGSGQVSALNQDGTQNSASNAALTGTTVMLSATGGGTLSPAVSDGTIIPSTMTPGLALSVQVTIGGQNATVVSATATPQAVAGNLQIQARVPNGVAKGNAPIILTIGNASSPVGTTLAVGGCSYVLASQTVNLTTTGASNQNVGLTVTPSTCAFSVTSNSSWIHLNNITSTSFGYSADANPGLSRSGTANVLDGNGVTVATLTVNEAGQALEFYPVTPCRIADTRTGAGFSGQFGPPSMAGGATRAFNILSSPCAAVIPPNVAAYSLNFTVVPPSGGPAANLTTWPATQPAMPNVSTLNYSGSVVANAAIVPAGSNGAINVFVNFPTEVLFDINGYFAPPASSGLVFFPVTPCRVADTRNGAGFSGQFGPPTLIGGNTRTFNLPASSCGIPATASANSLNFTVVPPSGGPAANLTTWPATQPAMPNVSTLNYSGSVVANAAIVPAGSNGSINVFANFPTDMLFDTNGYFAPPGSGGLHFYPVTPCRIADTRNGAGFAGQFGPPAMPGGTTRTFAIPASSCQIPSNASAYSLNFTVIPPAGGPAANLTTWPAGAPAMPNVSTLNYYGSVVANAAIVPAGANGAINVFANFPTDVLFDINGYFAP